MTRAHCRLISTRAPVRGLVASDGQRGYSFVSIAAITFGAAFFSPTGLALQTSLNLSELKVISPASQDGVQFLFDEPIQAAAFAPTKAFLKKLLSDSLQRSFGHFESWLNVRRH